MIENLKIRIDEAELKNLLINYYKEVLNDDSIQFEYRSKFRYIDGNSGVAPNVWGVITRNVKGEIKKEPVALWNMDLSHKILNSFNCESLQWNYDIECDMKTPAKTDSERIVFKGVILNLKLKSKINDKTGDNYEDRSIRR